MLLRVAGGVLLDRDEGRGAAALEEDLAHPVAGGLGGDQGDVDVGRRLDGLEADVEPVGEHQHLAGAQVRRDLLGVYPGLRGVGGQDHDDVGPGRRVAARNDGQALGLGLRLRPAAGVQRHPHLDPAVLQVQRMRVALRAVAEDRDLPALDVGEVRGVVVVDRCHLLNPRKVVVNAAQTSGDGGRRVSGTGAGTQENRGRASGSPHANPRRETRRVYTEYDTLGSSASASPAGAAWEYGSWRSSGSIITLRAPRVMPTRPVRTSSMMP